MANFTVPPKDQQALGDLANLPVGRMGALVQALKATAPTLLIRQLARKIAVEVNLPEDEALRFIRLLATMYAVRIRQGSTVEEFSSQVIIAADLKIPHDVSDSFKKSRGTSVDRVTFRHD